MTWRPGGRWPRRLEIFKQGLELVCERNISPTPSISIHPHHITSIPFTVPEILSTSGIVSSIALYSLWSSPHIFTGDNRQRQEFRHLDQL